MIVVGHIENEKPEIEGSQCDFSDAGGIVLRSDWVSRFWMNINGSLVEFHGTRTDEAKQADIVGRRWRESFRAKGIYVLLNLKQTATGDDGAAFEGSIIVKRDGIEMHLKVAGVAVHKFRALWSMSSCGMAWSGVCKRYGVWPHSFYARKPEGE